MKHIFSAIIITFCLCMVFTGCDAAGKARGGSSISADDRLSTDASYALGMNIGSSLKTDQLYPEMDEFRKGIEDILTGADTRFTMDEAYEIFFASFNELRQKREESSKQAEIDFLADNSKKAGIHVTGSGLQYEIINDAIGPKPGVYDTVKVHYEGTLIDGTVFDSSISRGEPVEFEVSRVISGWTEGLQLMSVGSKYRLFIPSDLGYGPQGMGGLIPPYSALIFEVELLDIIPHEHSENDPYHSH